MPAVSLMEALADVPDPRGAQGKRHPLTAILGLTVVAVLSGMKSPLRGAVVTGCAMFTDRDVCTASQERGGDYLLPVKDNQATLQADIRTALGDGADVSPLPAAAAAPGAADRHGPRQGPRPRR